jgi:hypothetical protein
MRSIFVFLGGIIVSFAVPLILSRLILPGDAQWIGKAFTTPSASTQWDEIWRHLQNSAMVQVYLINPLGGLAVGVFVGLLQRNRVTLVAASCLVPDFVTGLLGGVPRIWARSAAGIAVYLFDHALPFAVAIIGAALCHYVVVRKDQADAGQDKSGDRRNVPSQEH